MDMGRAGMQERCPTLQTNASKTIICNLQRVCLLHVHLCIERDVYIYTFMYREKCIYIHLYIEICMYIHLYICTYF